MKFTRIFAVIKNTAQTKSKKFFAKLFFKKAEKRPKSFFCNFQKAISSNLKLAVIKGSIEAALSHKLVVRALFDDIAVLHNEDKVCLLYS